MEAEASSPKPEHDHLLLEMTADIVSAYVSKNAVTAAELPALIADIHAKMKKLRDNVIEPAPAVQKEPVVSIKKSVTPDFIICLEDGKKFKSLRRHLSTAYGLTPQQYRAKWSLPKEYPMVAPNYAAQRSSLAKKLGLGRKAGEAPKAKAPKKAPAKKAA